MVWMVKWEQSRLMMVNKSEGIAEVQYLRLQIYRKECGECPNLCSQYLL